MNSDHTATHSMIGCWHNPVVTCGIKCCSVCVSAQRDSVGLLEHLLMKLLNDDSWSGNGWIHRLDLFAHVLHSEQESDLTGYTTQPLYKYWE